MTDRRFARALSAALALGAAGCGATESTPAAPCGASYDDALFTVVSATDARTRAPLARVLLRGYTFGGSSEAGLGFLTLAPGLQPRNVAVTGTELSCNVACAFGAVNGDYTLTFGAAGYRDTTLQFLGAGHGVKEEGCPARFRDGLDLDLVLTPI